MLGPLTPNPMKLPAIAFPSVIISLMACSCQSVSIADQGTLSKSAMSFDASGARSAEISLTSQVERGRSLTNASTSGGCASCQ